MRRLLVCLSLCLVLAPDVTLPRPEASHPEPGPLARAAVLAEDRPAEEGKGLPDTATMEKLAKTDPVAFLEACIRKHDTLVKTGYTLTLQKQERLGGKLQLPEVIEVAYRVKPFSVRMEWKKGARRAQRTLYVEGQNDNQLLVRPTGAIASLVVVSRDPNGADVKESSRYTPTEFGFRTTMEKTLQPWLAARKRGDLKVEYLGEKRVKEAGDRVCWVLQRTGYTRTEEDGIQKATFYFDKETWLQVGTVLRGADDQLLGEYFFRDIKLNPDFAPDTFTRKSL